MPSLVTKSRPKNARPVTEMATVRPAKSTARPADAPASAAASREREPLVEVLPEPRDDEQRVVDADAEADHRDEDRGDRVDVGQAGEDEQQEERGQQRDDREHDRDERRDERAEDDEQHDDRREQAEQLGGSLLDRRELRLAVVLDRHPGRLDRLADGVLHGDDLVPVGVLDRLVELRLGVGDTAVLRERVRAERVADAREAGIAILRLELGRPELRHGLLDRRLALRGVEPLPLGRGEDDVEDGALLGREALLDQVGRPLGVRARDLELVAQAAADRGDECDQDDDDAEPRPEDAPRMRGAAPGPARERARRHPLVGGQPVGRSVLSRSHRVVGHASLSSPRVPVRPKAPSTVASLDYGGPASGGYGHPHLECLVLRPRVRPRLIGRRPCGDGPSRGSAARLAEEEVQRGRCERDERQPGDLLAVRERARLGELLRGRGRAARRRTRAGGTLVTWKNRRRSRRPNPL